MADLVRRLKTDADREAAEAQKLFEEAASLKERAEELLEEAASKTKRAKELEGSADQRSLVASELSQALSVAERMYSSEEDDATEEETADELALTQDTPYTPYGFNLAGTYEVLEDLEQEHLQTLYARLETLSREQLVGILKVFPEYKLPKVLGYGNASLGWMRDKIRSGVENVANGRLILDMMIRSVVDPQSESQAVPSVPESE